MSDLVRIFISGDFCSTPSTEHITVSESLKYLIKSCDISICNLESPILPPGRKSVSGRIYQSENVPEFLSETGFNVITLANNHAFDYGDEGYSYTVSVKGLYHTAPVTSTASSTPLSLPYIFTLMPSYPAFTLSIQDVMENTINNIVPSYTMPESHN